MTKVVGWGEVSEVGDVARVVGVEVRDEVRVGVPTPLLQAEIGVWSMRADGVRVRLLGMWTLRVRAGMRAGSV